MEYKDIVPYNPLAWPRIQKLNGLRQKLEQILPSFEKAQRECAYIKQQVDNISAEIWMLSTPESNSWSAYYNNAEEFENYLVSKHPILKKTRNL